MRKRTLLAAIFLACILQSGRVCAQAGSPAQSGPSASQKYFTDVSLVDQDGKEHRFYSDLIKDRVVIINSMFTSCTSVCPVMTSSLQRIQDWLGDRLGKEVVILSFSVDPVNDSPRALKEFAQKYNARPGWYFLTGKKENLDASLHKLGLYVENRDDHSTVLLIGNDRTGLWKKALAMSRPETLIEIVASVVNDRPAK